MKTAISILLIFLSLLACDDKKTTRENSQSNREFIPEPDAQKELSTAEVIAYKNRFDKWSEVNEIQFTFNVDRGENHFERSWIWKPKTMDVTMMTQTDTVSYNRITADSLNPKVDGPFINDKFWLLMPFQLMWDEGTNFDEKYDQIAPISKDTMNVLTVVYGSEGGYTPGDAYDLFYDDEFMLREWVYRAKNDSVPTMTTTWEDYETFKGIPLAKMHKDATGGFKLYFTNITIN